MLVLSRRVEEEIRIGPDVVVRILSIRGDVVRLGVEAPRSVAVDRPEIADSKIRDGTLSTTPAIPPGWSDPDRRD